MNIKLTILSAVLCISTASIGQTLCGPALITSNDTSICPGNTITLTSVISPSNPIGGTSTPITGLSDDVHSGVLPIGFTFNFYGVNYTQCVASSNDYLTFNTAAAGTYSAWSIPGPAPSASTPALAIMCPWQDILPTSGGVIRYQTIGTAPNRVFILEYCNIPMFSCTGLLFTDQIKLFETSNIIETHITNKPLCSTWNGGKAIHGLSKNSTVAHIVPGRNATTTWTAANDGYRFTPDPADVNNYIIAPTPYCPYLVNVADTSIKWTIAGGSTTPISIGTSITVTPTVSPTLYVATISSGGDCNAVTYADTVIVDFNSTYYDTISVSICKGETYDNHGQLLFQTGTFTQVLSKPLGCDSSFTVLLSAKELPDVTIAANSTSICAGDQATIQAQLPSSNVGYQWFRNGSILPGETASALLTPQSGEYRLVGTLNGCSDTSRRVTINQNPAAIAKIEVLDTAFDKLCIGDTVTLKAASYGNYDYRWTPEKNFRNLSGTRYATAKGVISEPGFVFVTAINQFGCKATDSVYLNPVACCDVYIASAFSPNGDGQNDFLNLKMQPGQRIMNFQIFNRRGNLVYENTNNVKGWDGNYTDGTPAGQEVYFYRILYTCTDGTTYERKGDVTLVR